MPSGYNKGEDNPMYGIHRYGENAPYYGKKHSEEWKERMRNIITGKKRTIEQRKRISDNTPKGEKSPLFGRHPSIETRRKMIGLHKGEKHGNWKGGKTKDSAGYPCVLKPIGYHSSNNRKYILEHRLIMEQILGRYLKPFEIVHHKNGIKDDNRPENLVLTVKGKNWHPHTCPKCGFEFLIE